MNESRRQFLSSSALLPIALGLPDALVAEIDESGVGDPDTLKFWTTKVRQPTDNIVSGATILGSVEEPEFVFFDPATKAFDVASNLGDQDLPPSGDAKVTVRVERFRPSTPDAQEFRNAKTGTLRIDLGQVTPLPGLTEALAWTAIAAFLPAANNQLPSLDKLQFDPGKTWANPQDIPIPDGLGYWTWNFFLKKPENLWGKIISLFTKTGDIVFPVLGLPGIALTALKAVDKMLGYVQAAEGSRWLLQSVNKPVFATKAGKERGGSDAIRLRTGTYLVMPQSHLSAFGKAASKLEVQSGGYVVPKGTDQFQRIRVAGETVPEVTYLAVSVVSNVTKRA